MKTTTSKKIAVEKLNLEPLITKSLRATISKLREVKLGFVNLGEDTHPITGKEYNVISAGSNVIQRIPYAQSEYKCFDMDIYRLYIDDLPDFGKNNEGLLEVSIDTRDPQNINSTSNAKVVTDFRAKDGSAASSFLFKGIFRNVIFRDFINLRLDLHELDKDADEYLGKIKDVINDIPEIKSLDILKGIPYLSLATKLFEGIIRTFGVNPDDHVWGEIPLLELNPTPGGAFLRNGIYVLYEAMNSNKEEMNLDTMAYVNDRIITKGQTELLSNHLLFGIRISEYRQKI